MSHSMSSIRRKIGSLGKLADDILFRQYELEHEYQTQEHCQGFLEQSISDLIIATDASLDQDDWRSQRDRLVAIKDQLAKDLEALTLQSPRLKALRADSMRLQSRLKARTDKIVTALSKTPELQRQADQAASESDVSTASSTFSSQTSTPSLLAAYYDSKGDLGIFRERLQELEADFRDGLVERDFLLDRGDEPDVPNDQFQAAFESQRQIIVDDIMRTEASTAALAQQCAKAGLQIVDLRRTSGESLPSARAVQPEAIRTTLRTITSVVPTAPSLATNPMLSARKRTHIGDWLKTLSDPEQAPVAHPSPPHLEVSIATVRNQKRPRSRTDIATPETWDMLSRPTMSYLEKIMPLQRSKSNPELSRARTSQLNPKEESAMPPRGYLGKPLSELNEGLLGIEGGLETTQGPGPFGWLSSLPRYFYRP